MAAFANRRLSSVLTQLSCTISTSSSTSSSSASSSLSTQPCSASDWATADLCDKYQSDVFLLDPALKSFGKTKKFHGIIHTVKVFEDNALIRTILERPSFGTGKVLLIDGGASTRVAILGDQLATLAVKNGWQGVVVHGSIRDSAVIGEMALGVRALGTSPLKSVKRGWGVENVEIQFGHGATVKSGMYLFADEDGVLVSAKKLL